jgi:murein DD-endopeptidase MepM/ murein hydrolase activator NlpD
MPTKGGPRRKKQRLFEILVVPLGEGKKARTFRTSTLRLAILVVATVVAIVGATLAVLMFTPLALYVPIPNPELEARYGKMIRETQERLTGLAQEVILLRDYNQQMRHALGEGARDSSTAKNAPVVSAKVDTGSKLPPFAMDGPAPEYDEISAERAAQFASIVTARSEGKSRLPFMNPTDGYVSQGFDPSRNHFGMDFAGKRGTPVYAAAEGYVVFAGWTYQDGNTIIIQHNGGFVTVYKHTQALLRSGQTAVKGGEPIALLGSSGKTSLGPHLHFELWKDGVPQDPNQYLLTPARGQ